MPDDPSKEHLPDSESESEDAPPSTPEEMLQSILNPKPPSASETLAPPEDSPAWSPPPKASTLARPEDLQFVHQSDEPDTLVEPPAHLRAAAERFVTMQNQAAAWTDRLNNREIAFDEYRRLLYDNMVQDEAGVWWMIDAENEQWYRHNPDSNEWEEDTPPALRELERYHRAEAADAPPSSQPQAGDPIVDARGVQIGTVQPTADEHYTLPGTAALADELPDQKATVRAESSADATRQSASRLEIGRAHV